MSETKVLAVQLRAVRANVFNEEKVAVEMTQLTRLGNQKIECGIFHGVAVINSVPLYPCKILIPSKNQLFELDESGFLKESMYWTPEAVTADMSRWWRVVSPFTSWSRKAMHQEANLLKIMPCELCWFSKKAQEVFIAVYLALAALPRDVVDAHVLPWLSSKDITI